MTSHKAALLCGHPCWPQRPQHISSGGLCLRGISLTGFWVEDPCLSVWAEKSETSSPTSTLGVDLREISFRIRWAATNRTNAGNECKLRNLLLCLFPHLFHACSCQDMWLGRLERLTCLLSLGESYAHRGTWWEWRPLSQRKGSKGRGMEVVQVLWQKKTCALFCP